MTTSNPLLFKLSLITLAIFQVHLAHAEDTTLPVIELQADASGNQSSEQTKSYIIKKSSSATKLNIDAQETPQTINVVTRQQMDDFNLSTTRDILNNTPGVTVTGLETNRTTYTARGLDISNILVDGVGFPQLDSYNYNNVDPDSYFYDRIEVIKGADALTNALGDPGATINYIRKRPTKEFQANAGISYGSWDTQRYEADISGLTKDGSVRGRITAFEKTGDSYLDKYSEEKNGIQAILEADLTSSTTASVGYSRLNQYTNGSQWGALPLVNDAGQPLSYSRSYNYAPSWTFYDWNVDEYFADITQKLGGDWVAKATYNYKNSTNDNQMLYLSGNPSATDNTSGIYLYPEIYNQVYRDKNANLDIQGTFPLLGQRHELDFGYSWANQTVKSQYAYGSSMGIFTTDLASWSPATQTFGEFYDAATTDSTLKSYYAATRLHFGDNLKLMLGANHSEIKTTEYTKDKFVPYAGLTYNFTPEYTGYMSYTSIFRPQTVVDETTNQTAAPVEGKSYEIGVKSSWLDDRLTGNLAVFRTDEENFALNPLYDATIFKYKSPIGTLRSQGVEVGLSGKVTDNLDLIFGFSTFSLKNMDNGDRARPNIPTQTINLLATYSVPQLPKLKVGAGIKWQDNIRDTSYPTVSQDSYALLSAMASYEINNHILIQANGNNLTNEKYLTGLSGGQGYYGAPANYTVAVKFKY
ncbi:TonB-dependent siderophore receptor [Acinetobacter ursingii]|uniref:TonB-dependent siderophore receptor n=1 Tax=Acinetobacter ursingii TaxID=108980 RepID=UPI00125035E9|nr:TonB-dependent siderophore receptor [Acinetobacter ursingii]MCU4349989.1 TonB-dependent siderophore receptor [Acinetobacter ursingii]MDI3236911.1 TonB-dependent siderophore receptor [Acinetobacter ursingii]